MTSLNTICALLSLIRAANIKICNTSSYRKFPISSKMRSTYLTSVETYFYHYSLSVIGVDLKIKISFFFFKFLYARSILGSSVHASERLIMDFVE